MRRHEKGRIRPLTEQETVAVLIGLFGGNTENYPRESRGGEGEKED